MSDRLAPLPEYFKENRGAGAQASPRTARCEPPCIHPRDLIGALDIRTMASGRRRTPISRHTLAAWRNTDSYPPGEAFPEPIAVLAGAGPGGSAVELWDRRAVKAWLRSRR